MLYPGSLHTMHNAVLGQPFDGGDFLADGVAQLHAAGAHRRAVDLHGAGAALRDATYFVPVRPRFSRGTQSSGVSASASTSKLFPLTERMAMFVFSVPDKRRWGRDEPSEFYSRG